MLLDWRTVIDNVLLPIEFRRGNKKEFSPRANDLLVLLGLDGFQRRYPWELSGGMRQRVAISRALLVDPELLLMDEPFGALDMLTRDELNIELQRIWNETRKTVLFITHSVSEAVFLSDRVVVMKKEPGEIVESLDIDLPRPRRLAMRETKEFTAHSSKIREIFERIGGVAGALIHHGGTDCRGRYACPSSSSARCCCGNAYDLPTFQSSCCRRPREPST